MSTKISFFWPLVLRVVPTAMGLCTALDGVVLALEPLSLSCWAEEEETTGTGSLCTYAFRTSVEVPCASPKSSISSNSSYTSTKFLRIDSSVRTPQ